MNITTQKLSNRAVLTALCASALFLTGCGGGGTGSSDSGASPGVGTSAPVLTPSPAPNPGTGTTPPVSVPDSTPISTPAQNPDPATEPTPVPTPQAPEITPVPTPQAPETTPDTTPAATPVPAAKVFTNFTATDAEIPNPERGFYRWAWSDLNQFSKADGDDAYKSGIRIVYAMVRLDAYKSAALPASLLTGLRTGFSNARQSGIKIIPRFVYNYPANETEYRDVADASLTNVLAHIAQLKPVLQENSDVIAYLQAGFIGAWGEWHTSSNGLTSTANRTSIRDALLDAMPKDQFVQFRYPPHLMAWSATAPAEASAFDGSAASRSGVHNDCFLASSTDVGTYSDNATTRAQQRSYTLSVAKVAPFGGETCNPADEANAQPRTSCADILGEGKQFSLTYLNNSYYTEAFHSRWKKDGCYAQVQRLMGYRIEFVSAEHAAVAAAGSAWPMKFVVRNIGWARPYKTRQLAFLLKHRTGGNVIKLATSVDPRSWTADKSFTHDVSLAIPSGAPAGEYDVYAALPDGAAKLNGDVRFAVRPANADNTGNRQAWDAALGAFRIGTVVTLQ